MAPADDLFRRVDLRAEQAERRILDVRRGVVAEIKRLLSKLETSKGKLTSTKEALRDAQTIRAQILALMRREGLAVIADAAEEKAVQLAADIVRLTPDAPAGFKADVGPELDRIVSGELSEIGKVFKAQEQEIRRAIDRAVLGEAPLLRAIEAVAERAEVSFLRAQTAVDTAVRGVGAEAIVQQAIRGSDETGVTFGFRLSGPKAGGNIRPFCRKHVGKVFTAKALARLDDDPDLEPSQPRPVRIYRGGYNCRHLWAPIDLDDAKEQGMEIVK